MRKKILTLIFAAIFLCGVFLLLTSDNDMKNVGDVNLICDEDVYELTGVKVSKRYKDDIEEYDEPVLSDEADSLISAKKPDNTDDTDIGVKVQYKGLFIDKEKSDITYKIYDSDFKMLYETDTLNIVFEDAKDYYVSFDVKWGRVKNYVCMRYFFKLTT